MRPNRLRELLKAGKPSVGTHVMTTSPDIVEMIGKTGLIDYIEFVAEYAPYSL
ncbi:MAG: 2,4-dihydroxyhept-2-ene-1,7-dioic acid aldolase, partial [Dehalococcoidia bacterium]|nr:2,4-dihydroxyhept-2-ene-1,7-dioic acid aldolase [Dehalococcoidia bacterium]